jgi:hypothetical protein
MLNFIPIEGKNMDERDFLVIQFAYVIKDVVQVFVIYVHATLSNGCVVSGGRGQCVKKIRI